MGRIDYYRDPDAPRANSLVPGVSALVSDGVGRLVLHRRSDNGLWALPGGGMIIGESAGQAIVREVHEETGLEVAPEYVVGVYSDPDHVFAYDNGEVRQEYSVCMACRVTGGAVRVSDESTDVGWFEVREISGLVMHPRIRQRVTDYLAGGRGIVS